MKLRYSSQVSNIVLDKIADAIRYSINNSKDGKTIIKKKKLIDLWKFAAKYHYDLSKIITNWEDDSSMIWLSLCVDSLLLAINTKSVKVLEQALERIKKARAVMVSYELS
jgi:hypothetical protein